MNAHLPAPRAALLLLALLGAAGSAAVLAQEAAPALELASYPRTELTVTSGTKTQQFRVWVADTEPRAQQGLMFVRDLPASQGMVFPLDPPRIENMWMKNTYIELDMLFVGANGRVTKIIERARPLVLDVLSSDSPVSAVVELRGGEVARRGIKVGDTVRWKKPAPQ